MANEDDRPTELTEGLTAYDSREQTFARVMELGPSTVALRPIGGGVEWWQKREHVRPALASEVLAESMRASGLLSQRAS